MSDRDTLDLESLADSDQPEAEPEHFHAHAATRHESKPAPDPAPPVAATAATETAAEVTATEARPSRETKMADTRAAKMAELFEGKKYLILGEIHLGEDEQFQTPFGNRGRHGFVLKESSSANKIMVGETILRKAASLYDAVVGLPPEKPKRYRRTRQQKAEEDAQKAAVAAENQARILARFEAEHSITV